jgi:5-methyltetrahydropteroyltriglutamate--homocysteine methyltransferase
MPSGLSRILTSHAGSLPRPEDLIKLNHQRAAAHFAASAATASAATADSAIDGSATAGLAADGPAPGSRATPGFAASAAPDEQEYQRKLSAAVTEVVARQQQAGVDLVNDGEYGHSMGHRYDFGPWWTYVFQRLGGLEMVPPSQIRPPRVRPKEPGDVVLSTFPERRDWVQFAEAYGDPDSGVALPNRENRPTVPVCRGPIGYRGEEALRGTIANFKAALGTAGLAEGFLNAVGPASCARFANEFYESDEELLYACADAMRAEYKTIIDAGLVLQIDDPAIAENWDQINPAPTVEAYQRFTMIRIEALNHALSGLPADRIRFHLCWGSWHGPHVTDLPMADIIGMLLSINASAYSFEAANVRHEHEWKVWRDVTLPDGKVILPGVVSHSTNVVEHPELVADRIVRYAEIVGRDNVIASTDCGLGGRVHPQIAWAKLGTLASGAELASRRLWR